MNPKELKTTINVAGVVYYPIDMLELKEIIQHAVFNAVKSDSSEPPKFIKGIHELAKFLRVSPSKAQEIKNSGIIPFSQNGRTVLFDPTKVMLALENHEKKIKSKK